MLIKNRTNYGKVSIEYNGAEVSNNLPIDLKESTFYLKFNKTLKTCIQHKLSKMGPRN